MGLEGQGTVNLQLVGQEDTSELSVTVIITRAHWRICLCVCIINVFVRPGQRVSTYSALRRSRADSIGLGP